MEIPKIPQIPQPAATNNLQLFENEQEDEKMNLEEGIELPPCKKPHGGDAPPIPDDLKQYVSMSVDGHQSTENVGKTPISREYMGEDEFNTIDARKLAKLVMRQEPLWNLTLTQDERSLSIRNNAWLSIKQDFNDEFTIDEIKRSWKRLKNRYFKKRKLFASPVDAFESEFLDLMSFLDGNDTGKDHQEDQETALPNKPNPDEISVPTFHKGTVDERELVKLVRTKDVIWNFDLSLKERSSPRRNFAWLEIKRDLNFEFTADHLKLVWKRLRERYFSYQTKKMRKLATHGSSLNEPAFENDFIEAMSFVNRLKKPLSAMTELVAENTEKKKRSQPFESRRYKKRKKPINQVFLPETNLSDVEMTDNLLPVKVEIEDNLNLTTDIGMNVGEDVKMEDEETTCRACLQTYAVEDMQMFFLINSSISDDVQLGVLYKEYVGYKNPKNESLLPTSICADCRRDLLRFHDFRNKCRSNETKYLGAVRCVQSNEMSDQNQDEEIVEDNYLPKNDSMHFDGKKEEIEQSIDQQHEEDQDDKSQIQRLNLYKCGKCGKTYSKRAYLWSHLRHTHKLSKDSVKTIRTELEKSEVYKIKEPPRPPKPTQPLSICTICGKSVKWINTHMKTHEEIRIKCTLCDRNYKSKELLSYHMKINHKGVKFTCQYCSKVYSSWSGRLVHIHLKHFKENPELQCEICKKCFPSTFTLKRHRRCHTKKKSFQCDLCSQVCASPTVLRHHKESLHLNTKWPCDQCESSFKGKKQLQQHIEKHLGEKNYECPVCSLAFAQNVVMRAHVEKLHPDYVLPPKGTVLHKKALEQIAMQREIEDQYVKIDFVERKK